MPKHKVAMLTAGGLAPCLSSAVAELIERYAELAPEAEMIGYLDGYRGSAPGSFARRHAGGPRPRHVLHAHGGSPIGNSRVKLTNVADCVKRGLVKEGEIPLQVAAEQLTKDGITILHTIGGDDTSTTAADLAEYLAENGYELTVVGLPKTVDNDIVPIRQSLGALTAAEQGAIFFENVVNEATRQPAHAADPRGDGAQLRLADRRHRARLERARLAQARLPAGVQPRARAKDDRRASTCPSWRSTSRPRRAAEAHHGRARTASASSSARAPMRRASSTRWWRAARRSTRDAFGHVKLDKVNVGDWFSKRLSKLVGAERTLVQKSGYFARSAPANDEDRRLIREMVQRAVACGLKGESGIIGHDEGKDGALRAIEFSRIGGGKKFDTGAEWFLAMLAEIGQPVGGHPCA